MSAQRSDISTELESWYARENGRYLLHSASERLAGMLDTSFGYHLLQLGPGRGFELLDASPINHRVICAEQSSERVGLLSRLEELPLESDSIDALVAHHSLDFCDNPHQALREMQRVLTPQGHLIIIGFNPYSLLGLTTRLQGMAGNGLWQNHRKLSEHRLSDWLHLLGCEVQECSRLYSLPPVGPGRLRHWLASSDNWCASHNLRSGGLYIMHAIKQVRGLHRPQLVSRRPRLIDLAVPKPVSRPAPTPATPTPVHRQGDSGT
jgi:SAM-dependent methyltransferase